MWPDVPKKCADGSGTKMKHDRSRSCVLAALLLMASMVQLPSGAAEPLASAMSPKEISSWKERLRRAGATREELAKFEDFASTQTPATVAAFTDYLQKTPPATFVRSLRGMVKWDQEPQLSAVFSDSAP